MNDLEVGYGGELDDLEKWIEYVKKKVDFKYFSPMHPDHKNNKLVLAKDEVDTKFFWKRAKGLAEYLLDGTYGKARHISKYFENIFDNLAPYPFLPPVIFSSSSL